MAWTKMADVPNPIIVDAAGTAGAGYVLKAYLPGTTTSTSIAIDSSGSSPQTTITANAEGKWEVSGNEIVPFIDRVCKWGIFENAADATANTPFYMGPFDNIPQSTAPISDASEVVYSADGVGAISTDVQDAMRNRMVSVLEYISASSHASIKDNTINTDLSSQINACMTAERCVYFPAGTYTIDGQGTSYSNAINVQSGSYVLLAPGAIIKILDQDYSSYAGFYIANDKSNIIIEGGQIRGDTDVNSSGGEAGFGVYVHGSSGGNITIKNMYATLCHGDGFTVGPDGANVPSGVTFLNCWGHDNRRNNFTVSRCAGRGVKIIGCTITNAGQTNGTSPKSGVQIEPEAIPTLRNVLIQGCKFKNNATTAIGLLNSSNVQIIGNDFTDEGIGISMTTNCTEIQILNNNFGIDDDGNVATGIVSSFATSSNSLVRCRDITISGNKIRTRGRPITIPDEGWRRVKIKGNDLVIDARGKGSVFTLDPMKIYGDPDGESWQFNDERVDTVNTSTDTVTVTRGNHIFQESGVPVRVTSTGSLPTGLSANTTYYIVSVTTSTLGFATSYSNAMAGTLIDLTGTGTGNIDIVKADTTMTVSTVTAATDQLTITNHGYEDGDRVRLTVSGGSLPTPISSQSEYWVSVVDANNIKLCYSKSAAIAGTPVVDITTTGSGTITVREAPAYENEFTNNSVTVITDPDTSFASLSSNIFLETKKTWVNNNEFIHRMEHDPGRDTQLKIQDMDSFHFYTQDNRFRDGFTYNSLVAYGNLGDNPTPDMSRYYEGGWKTGASGALTITDFVNVSEGQEIKIIGADGGNTTINDGGNFALTANHTIGDNDALTLKVVGSTKVETTYSNN